MAVRDNELLTDRIGTQIQWTNISRIGSRNQRGPRIAVGRLRDDGSPGPAPGLFVIHGVLQFGFAIVLVVAPAALIGWGEPFDPVTSRLADAFFVGLGQILAYGAETWDQVWLLYVVLSESIVGIAVVRYSAYLGTLNAGWLLLPPFIVFAPSFTYSVRHPLGSTG